MNTRVVLINNSIVYQLNGNTNLSNEELNRMFFSCNENGVYERKYPECVMFKHDLKVLENNYNLYLNDEFKNDKIEHDVESVLGWVCETHNKMDIKWWLAGSAALFARGLDISPHDIDIMTYKTEIEKIRLSVGQYMSEPFHHVSNWVVKGFGVIYNKMRIDYAFEPEDWVDNEGYVDFGPYAENNLETIKWNGYEIKVPPIKLHIRSNETRGRINIVHKILDYNN